MAASAEAPEAVKSGQCTDASFRWPFIWTKIRRHRGAEDFRRDILELQEGEVLRSLSGTADWRIFNEVGQELEQAHNEKGVTLRFMTGPILSISPEGENVLVSLAEQGSAELYRMPYRPDYGHTRVFGNRKCWIESHHQSFEPLRQRRISYTGPMERAARESDFDSKIKAFKLEKSTQPRKDFVLLTDEIHRELLEMARVRSINPVFLTIDEIRGLLGLGGQFRDLTHERLCVLQTSGL